MLRSVSLAGLPLAALLLVSCSSTDADRPASKTLQLVVADQPTATVTIRNVNDFTIGVVTFEDCDSDLFARPEPQVIEPGQSASYEVAARCYAISAGEAGLSFKFAFAKKVTLNSGDAIELP